MYMLFTNTDSYWQGLSLVLGIIFFGFVLMVSVPFISGIVLLIKSRKQYDTKKKKTLKIVGLILVIAPILYCLYVFLGPRIAYNYSEKHKYDNAELVKVESNSYIKEHGFTIDNHKVLPVASLGSDYFFKYIINTKDKNDTIFDYAYIEYNDGTSEGTINKIKKNSKYDIYIVTSLTDGYYNYYFIEESFFNDKLAFDGTVIKDTMDNVHNNGLKLNNKTFVKVSFIFVADFRNPEKNNIITSDKYGTSYWNYSRDNLSNRVYDYIQKKSPDFLLDARTDKYNLSDIKQFYKIENDSGYDIYYTHNEFYIDENFFLN